jgi:hypothetical protein
MSYFAIKLNTTSFEAVCCNNTQEIITCDSIEEMKMFILNDEDSATGVYKIFHSEEPDGYLFIKEEK